MPLSTSSVFHFTKSIDAIIGILTNHFKIKYCLETIESREQTISYAVPMVSFCDIPLSQVSYHIEKYGGYGIGLLKKWAIGKGLNPVLYLEKNSAILNGILKSGKFQNTNNVVQEFLRYTKNYEGQLFRGGELVQKKYRYYDEREWRFSQESPVIYDTDYYQQNKNTLNESLKVYKLDFTIKEISYIIVDDKSEILNVIDFLESNLKKESDRDNVKILLSKIITSKQIKTDF